MADCSLSYLISAVTGGVGILVGWLAHRRTLLGPKPTVWAECSQANPEELSINIYVENIGKIPIYLVDVISEDCLLAKTIPLVDFSQYAAEGIIRVNHTGEWKDNLPIGESIQPGERTEIYLVANSDQHGKVFAKLLRRRKHSAPNAYRVRLRCSDVAIGKK